jgi:glutamate-1-semialdehyde 2,1-aminomutase
MIRTKSAALYDEALRFFPGGVNSPVRAFRSVGGTPLFIDRGQGPHIWDADGQKYLDFCCSWGPLILGHAHTKVMNEIVATLQNGTSFGAPTRKENELASTILANHRYIDKIRFVNSGTEAVMSAVRLARGFTGKNKILKFEGCYHGHVDSLLVKAGSGLVTLGTSSSAGVPENTVRDTIVVALNDEHALEQAITTYKNDLAAVIIEPIPANNGLLLQTPEYLKFVREITEKHGVLLIFDEVISGFRAGFEGAAGRYNIAPDIITFGKIIGGGLPVGAYGARNEIMRAVSPDGPVYQAGTLSGNPVAMAAGHAQLLECLQPGFYEDLERKTGLLTSAVNKHAADNNYPFKMVQVASIFWLSFGGHEAIRSANEIQAEKMSWFNTLHQFLLERGIYLGPSGYEVGFVSQAHTDDMLLQAAGIFCEGLDLVFKES